MNPQTLKEAEELFDATLSTAADLKGIELIVCPSFVYLDRFAKKLRGRTKLGAQNMHWDSSGAYTGEVSGPMLKDLGAEYVILGHSERRYKMGEADEIVNKKVKAALKYGLAPIIAVGERERTNFDNSGKYISAADDAVIVQLSQALKDIPVSKLKDIIIAYEPVWAIGTGLSDTPDDALAVSLLIRKVIAKMSSLKIANEIPVLYGGSVDSKNVSEFTKQDGIDGVLVGGASAKAEEFAKMLEIIMQS
jgi:triosephosphate isomerase